MVPPSTASARELEHLQKVTKKVMKDTTATDKRETRRQSRAEKMSAQNNQGFPREPTPVDELAPVSKPSKKTTKAKRLPGRPRKRSLTGKPGQKLASKVVEEDIETQKPEDSFVPEQDSVPSGNEEAVGPEIKAANETQHEPPEVEEPAPGKKQRVRNRSTRAKVPNDGDYIVDEKGKEIPLPPKHGSPIMHTRPKSASRMLKAAETMKIFIHARKNDGAWGAVNELPTATVEIASTASLAELRTTINKLCPYLPPQAQHFFQKAGEDFQRLDSTPAYKKTLSEAGYELPGPHNIWMEIDIEEICKAAKQQTAPAPSPSPAKEPASQASPSKSRALVASRAASEPHRAAGDESDGKNEAARAQQATGSALASPPAPLALVTAPQAAILEQPAASDISKDFAEEGGPSPVIFPAYRPIVGARNRSNKRWNEQEINNLLLGLMKYGTSSWTKIAERWNFEDRTTVDLKDKWRNLVKNVRDGRPMRGITLTEDTRNRVWRIMKENCLVNPEVTNLTGQV